jgi:hypothetical protein
VVFIFCQSPFLPQRERGENFLYVIYPTSSLVFGLLYTSVPCQGRELISLTHMDNICNDFASGSNVRWKTVHGSQKNMWHLQSSSSSFGTYLRWCLRAWRRDSRSKVVKIFSVSDLFICIFYAIAHLGVVAKCGPETSSSEMKSSFNSSHSTPPPWLSVVMSVFW